MRIFNISRELEYVKIGQMKRGSRAQKEVAVEPYGVQVVYLVAGGVV